MSTSEPTLDPPCVVRANPDIAGIGVRVAIYIQASLNIICAVIFSIDAWITVFEHTVLTAVSTNLFLTGCALLICAFVQGATFGLTVHHAMIVLNLNWLIGFSALLYVFIWAYNSIAATIGRRSADPINDDEDAPSGRSMLMLSIAHLCGMGAFGVWVWMKIRPISSFGEQPECTPYTRLTVFAKDLSVRDSMLRRISLVIYWMIALPFINIFLIFMAALVVIGFMRAVYWAITRFPMFMGLSWRSFILFGGIVAIALLDVLFIVDTELTMSRAIRRGFIMKGEDRWTFGQTLALVSLIIPVLDTAKMVWKARDGLCMKRQKMRSDEKVLHESSVEDSQA